MERSFAVPDHGTLRAALNEHGDTQAQGEVQCQGEVRIP